MEKRDLRTGRLKRVSREYRTAVAASAVIREQLRANPSWLADRQLRLTDFREFGDNLEATYLIRLFAEFESALREFWNSIGRQTHPRTADLLDALASRRTIPAEVRMEVHAVRQYRNAIVNEEAIQPTPVRFEEAIARLQRFVGRIPADW